VHISNTTGNRTIDINVFENISLYYQKNYTIFVEAFIAHNSTNVSGWFTTGSEVYCMALAFDTSQVSIAITMMLFFYFFFIGYTNEKRSGGALMLISGFMLLGLEVLILDYVSAFFVIPFISPVAIYIIILGIYKQFYIVDDSKVRREGQ
jgi:hypothetical protein